MMDEHAFEEDYEILMDRCKVNSPCGQNPLGRGGNNEK